MNDKKQRHELTKKMGKRNLWNFLKGSFEVTENMKLLFFTEDENELKIKQRAQLT